MSFEEVFHKNKASSFLFIIKHFITVDYQMRSIFAFNISNGIFIKEGTGESVSIEELKKGMSFLKTNTMHFKVIKF